MLLEKYNKDDIIVFRTVGSDEVIAKVISDKPEEFTLSKPLALAQTPQGIGMTFYMIMADQENEFVVQKANIITVAKANKQAEESYKKSTSNIVQPPKSQIIT